MFESFFLLKDLVLQFWWTFTPIVLFFILGHLWMTYIQLRYESGKTWALLEIKLPREVLKTPKAMEQVFSGLHGVYSEPNLIDKYINGETMERFSLEVVGLNGVTHFHIRTNVKFRNLVEAQIYAQYPEAEIHEAEDYSEAIPPDIPNKDYDLWGTELVLSKPDAYPIRTYFEFEDPKDERRIDPLASLTELLSKLEQGSQLWIQFIISPAPDTWHAEGQKLVSQLIGRKETKQPGAFDDMGASLGVLFKGGEEVPKQSERKGGDPASQMMFLSPGQRTVIEAIEKNISKIGFHVTIRIVYLARHEVFTKANVAGILGCFRQFNTLHLNGFKPSRSKTPGVDYLFKRTRNFARKRTLFQNFKKRKLDFHPIILNTEELATIYHFPGKTEAPAPFMQRVEAKKGAPPSGLPTE